MNNMSNFPIAKVLLQGVAYYLLELFAHLNFVTLFIKVLLIIKLVLRKFSEISK